MLNMERTEILNHNVELQRREKSEQLQLLAKSILLAMLRELATKVGTDAIEKYLAGEKMKDSCYEIVDECFKDIIETKELKDIWL